MKLEDLIHQRLLDGGYFAVVQHYKDSESGTDLAVKRLKKQHRENEDYRDRLLKEIEILEELAGTEGVVELVASNTCDSDPYYVMPLAEANLHRFIRRNNAELSLQQRSRIFERVAKAVEAAHERGFLHRDLCPSNVLVLKEANVETVVVSDFGLGRDLAADSTTRSSAGHYGHTFYVAPEQRESLKAATVRSDIYSLGKLLNFIMTGKDPDHHHRCAYSSLITRATEIEPGDRYPTVTHMLEQFEQVADLLEEPRERTTATGSVLRDQSSLEAPAWQVVHSAVASPEYDGHVYYDYLKPTIDFFTGDRLAAYQSAIGGSVYDFVQAFTAELDSCMATVGWPFSATSDFAHFLTRVFRHVQEPRSRQGCLVALWDVAYGADQWGAQKICRALLTANEISQEEAVRLGEHILESGMVIDDPDLRLNSLPSPIRNAVLKTRESAV